MDIDSKIRAGASDDANWLKACTDQAYDMYVPILGRKPQPMTLDYQAALENFDIWIAEQKNTRAGLLMLQHEEDHTVIYSVAVLPAYAGQGIGKLLLRQAEQVAIAKGFKLLRLYTNELMTRNLAMYRGLGYVDSHHTQYKGSRIVHLKKTLSG